MPALRSRTGLEADACARALAAPVGAGEVAALPTTPPRYLSGPVYRDLEANVAAALQEFHRREPLKEGLPREELRTRLFHDSHSEVFRCLLAAMAARGTIRADKDRVALASHRIALSSDDALLMERIETRFVPCAGIG